MRENVVMHTSKGVQIWVCSEFNIAIPLLIWNEKRLLPRLYAKLGLASWCSGCSDPVVYNECTATMVSTASVSMIESNLCIIKKNCIINSALLQKIDN
jgi:hypothetical protein